MVVLQFPWGINLAEGLSPLTFKLNRAFISKDDIFKLLFILQTLVDPFNSLLFAAIADSLAVSWSCERPPQFITCSCNCSLAVRGFVLSKFFD